MDKKATVIGIGNAGIKVVEKLGFEGYYGDTSYSTIAVGTQVGDLARTMIIDKVQIGIETCKGGGIGETIDVGRAALAEQLGQVMEAIGNTDYILLVAGFGSGSSAGATIELAVTLEKLEIPAVCLVIKPFDFEGDRRLNNYLYGTLDLTVNAIEHQDFEADEIVKLAGNQKMTVQQMFEMIDEVMIEKIENVLRM